MIKFGKKVLVDMDLMSSVAAIKDLFVAVESVL